MGNIFRRSMLILGLLLYLVDYGSDIYVAIQYWKNNEDWWFSMTIIFITAPSILVNITAIIQVINIWGCIAAVLQLSIVVRNVEAIISPETHAILLAKLRYLETITESAPQWCLQVYIMLRQWYFPWYTVLSTILSLLSLAWSITALEDERAKYKRRDFRLSARVSFLIWQLFTLISRVSIIVIVAYVFRYYATIFLIIHWLVLMAAMLLLQDDGLIKALYLSWLAGYATLFHYSKTDILSTRSHKVEMVVGYILLLVENAIILTLSFRIEIPDAPHMDVLKPTAISCVIIGSVLSLMGFLFYYCCADRDL